MEDVATETMAIIRYIFITACSDEEKDNFL